MATTTPSPSITRILVPTDFSDTAAGALAYARELVRLFDATLHLLHVMSDPGAQPWAGEAAGLAMPDLRQVWQASADRRLAALDTGGCPTERVTRVGHAFVGIVQYARERQIDLIVMGTHGRGAIEHMLLGSVAEKVVRKAHCPVLTVRDPGHTFVMPVMPIS